MIPIKTLAVSSKNKKILKMSSSGGAFYYLCKNILEDNNGVVYGVSMEDTKAKHIRINDIKDINKILKSKYVKSDIGNSFKLCSDDLSRGLNVLFSGTPCQINGLITYLEFNKINYERLIAVDLICHGVPKEEFFNNYINSKFQNEKIKNIDFRNKKYSWENYSTKILGSKHKIDETFYKNAYMQAFLNNYILSEECYDCKFKSFNRKSDLTLGDFWGCKEYYKQYFNKNGVSLVVVNNTKAEKFIENAFNEIDLNIGVTDLNFSLFLNDSYNKSAIKPKDLEEKLNRFKNDGFSIFTNKKISINRLKKIALSLNFVKYKKLNKYTGIITDYGYSNFGNRLQNFALFQIIKENGGKPINIVYSRFVARLWNKIRFTRKEKAIYKSCKKTKEKNYYFLPNKKGIRTINTLDNLILGSDQIWNSSYNYYLLPFNLGMFAKNCPISSYGASFGDSRIPDYLNYMFLNQFLKFKNIGLREIPTEGLVKILPGNYNVVLDPTLLINLKQWNEYIDRYSKIKYSTEPFIFMYFLCKRNIPDGELKANIKTDAKYFDANSETKSINHFDFIKGIRDSLLVITDSYHALIFSIIFKKKIILYKRNEMEGRIISLFKLLKINLKYNEVIDLKSISIKKEIIDESIEFLKKCFNK